MIYLRLFWEFFKTGLFSVGGGLATLPFIYDMSDRTGWFTYQPVSYTHLDVYKRQGWARVWNTSAHPPSRSTARRCALPSRRMT